MTIQSKIATIGWYYDAFQSSFSDAKLHGFVDHLAALGYTGITYRFNVNVAKSGEVLNTYKQDRLDQIIAYTQTKGMGVNLVTNWVYDGTQDIVGTGWPSIPAGFDTAKFLVGVAQYFKSAAAHFEAVKAETLFVGFENYPFVTSEFHSQWAAIIADIKTKYHGIVSYMSDTNWWPMTNVGIWDLVDKIGLLVNPNIGNAAPTSVQEVEQFYFQNPVDGSNTVKDLIELSRTYNKKLLLEAWFGNFDTVLNGNTDPFFAGNSFAKPLPINLQAGKIAFEATLDVFNKNLSTVTDGFGIGEYDVWVFGTWTGDPASTYLYSTWKDYTPWENPIAEAAISKFLKNDDSYRISNITNGSTGNDIIVLKSGNNLVNPNGGKDEIKLGSGSDTVAMLAQPTTVSLKAKLTSWFTSNASSPVNFEVLVNDKKIGEGSVVSSAAKLLSSPSGYWADDVQYSFLLPANTELSKVQVVSKSSGILQVSQITVGNVVLPPSTTNSVKDGQGNVKLNWVSSSTPSSFEVLPYIQNSALKTTVDGGSGIDKVAYPASSSDYAVSYNPTGTITVKGKIASSQLDVLSNIERVSFTDKSMAYDLNGNAGITAKILGAVFGSQALTNKNYVGIGLSFLDAGWSYDNLAALALDAAGAKTNDQIVSLLWANVIGGKATSADKAPYISLLENGMTPGALAHLAADTSFNTTSIKLVGLALSGLEYIPLT
jgi:hypothetical protein